ncbi:peptide chain release factor N(5)-glutamine methyltransferase [Leptospira fletcheri]|uniref:Release factor glutamine methyltransferase n=1 Tax=Leptospira fletcheri TaxID=2484981 RepID=A0A4R9GIW3_9LEPT|nr:peptide chain release factor N(5)-glutamine methyltransferase [Leptospira fletcheri]TGK12917.1 peptide chain release factor N(5)-glutamine methyltransferase [Leptospira fletcheri]
MQNSEDSVLSLLKKSEEFLKRKNIPSPRLDAELLLADLLKIPRVKLYVDFERPLSLVEKDAYRERILERSKSRPTAYIIGKKAFFDSEFYVDQNVLIPRPETEELVAWVLEDSSKGQDSQEVLDLCSGSGCIGISLAKPKAGWTLHFSDVSPEAMSVTKRNSSEILGGNRKIEFFESDLFSSIPKDKSFDCIVSNPPYIPEKEKAEIMPDVLNYEPHLALFLSDFEEFHVKLLGQALPFLKEGGRLYLETHPDYSSWLRETALKVGYSDVILRKDLSSKERFLRLTK